MDRGSVAKGIGVLMVVGGIVFLYFGGWTWLSGAKGKPVQEATTEPVPDPLYGTSDKYCASADGTLYVIGTNGKVFWLVAGQATSVECPEPIDQRQGFNGDAKGGLYVWGEKHLWYIYKGRAAQVKEVPRNQMPEGEHRVTTMSVNWSVLQSYGHGVYKAGYEAGYEAGCEAPGGDSGSGE